MIKKKFISLVFFIGGFSISIYSQQGLDSIKLLPEIVISGFKAEPIAQTSFSIASLKEEDERIYGTAHISEALTLLPGLRQLSTGPGISKPVIRGLYGNRIQILVNGLRFDNQQWQDEHGLGLSDLGVERMEVIKGPLAILYGSEAVGGVIHIIDEDVPKPNSKESNIDARIFSNTKGIILNSTLTKSKQNSFWRYNFGINSHADYFDGSNSRILNSRYGGYHLKIAHGINNGNWISYNEIQSSFDRFGFLTIDNLTVKEKDNVWSRTMDGPNHMVILNLFSSKNSIQLKNSLIKLNAGLQSNWRLENEGGGQISLNMHLISGMYSFQWLKSISKHIELILANQSMVQFNHNYGARVIIPNANIFETSGSAFIKFKFSHWVFESGVGANIRNIKTLFTRMPPSPVPSIPLFNITRPSLNGAIGLSFNPVRWFNAKANISTGYRSGNLAELASNGVHEGTYRWEQGHPDLKVEQNINSELSAAISTEFIHLSLAFFNNKFYNYIYLAPTGTQLFGFDFYDYKQNNAVLKGGEFSFLLKFPFLQNLSWETNYDHVVGKIDNGTYLPYIPSDRYRNEFRWTDSRIHKKIIKWYCFVGAEYNFKQNHPAQFESSTGDYALLNAGTGFDIATKKEKFRITLTGNNLLNRQYYDHLSRFKEYGIHNIGRNFIIGINLPI